MGKLRWQNEKETITRCVVLDAGHGGKDVGTSYGNIYEKDINLSIALEIKECLEQEGIEVILTRSSDEFISLEERAAAANQTDAEVFVSIHCNYYEDDSSVSGVEGYYCSDSEEGKELAESILSTLGKNESITVRNAKSEEYYVLEHTNMPALLLEVGYLSNFEERQQLSNGDYKKILSQEIAKGILSYFK